MKYQNFLGLFLILFAATILCSVSFFMPEASAEGVLGCVGSNAGTDNSTMVEAKTPLISNSKSNMKGDFDNWKVISGSWDKSSSLLKGGTVSNITDSVENIIVNPTVFTNLSQIETTFKMSEVHPNLSSYAYIIYSYLDPDNFKMAGVHVEKNNGIFVRFVQIKDGCLTTDPSYIYTGLNWQPNSTFKLALSSENGVQGLKLNGTQFAGNNDTTIDGITGLYYGRMNDIDFYNFSIIHPFITSDSQLLLLADKNLPSNDYIHLFDSSPYKITKGHISAKLPCEEVNSNDVQVLSGQISNLRVLTLQNNEELSNSDDLCQYSSDIIASKDNPITDLVLYNNSTEDIEFPDASSILVNIGELSK